MTSDQDLESAADPDFEQFFLVNPIKIRLLIEAAGITLADRVVELGAGAGTVARELPPCASLRLVELDDRLVSRLAANVPSAEIIQGDALALVESIPFDVLIGNLPTQVTERLFSILPRLSFRTAVLAVDEFSDLGSLESLFAITEVTRITGDDFRPSQPGISRIVKIETR